MALTAISPAKYGRLLAKTQPRVIENRAQFDHFAALMEELDRKPALDPEEEALLSLLEHLVKEYDDRVELPKLPPHQMIRFLMEQRDLRQADLLSVFGSRSVASDVITGRREPSKAHIRKLAGFFHVSPAVFL